MFGYVTPLEGELKVKEKNFYQSAYCGLCKAMGKRVCAASRMTLSYDILFLALLRFLLTEEKLSFRKTRCLASLRKKKVIVERNPSLDYAAAAGSLLAYHNVADDVADKRGLRRFAARMLLLPARRMRRKAALPELDHVIAEKLSALSAAEASEKAMVDEVATHFGELLAAVFAYDLSGESEVIAREMGFHLGKWIYIMDAADDYTKDKKRGEFNPLPSLDGERLRTALRLELAAATGAYELITPYDAGIKSLTDNIWYLGMPARIEKVLARCSDTEERTSEP